MNATPSFQEDHISQAPALQLFQVSAPRDGGLIYGELMR
jgi:hypothetical protein